MTDYIWYPVTGSGTAGNPYIWHNGLFNWNTGSFWADANQLILGSPTVMAGTVPGSGAGTSQGPGLDSVALAAGEISTSSLQLYNLIAPSLGDPIIGSNDYKVDVTINSGTVDLQNLALASAYSPQYSDIQEYPTLDVESATLKIEGSIANGVTVVFPQIGTQSAGGGGTIEIGSGGTVFVAGSVFPVIVVDFKDSASDLLTLGGVSIAQPHEFAGGIENFGSGDTIDLPSLAFSVSNTATFGTNHNLIISQGVSALATLNFVGTLSASSIVLQADGSGGTEIITCFVAGTHIQTARGVTAVEALREGDLVTTLLSDGATPIKWIGRRDVDCRRHPHPELVWPVRIAAGAFGNNVPVRDLLVSPDHAVFVDGLPSQERSSGFAQTGMLIPVKYLINGNTIVQVRRDEVVYYHIELPKHDVLLAEGLPLESYLDAGNRSAFDNAAHGVVDAYPDFVGNAWETTACARLVITGAELEAVRQRLQSRLAAAA